MRVEGDIGEAGHTSPIGAQRFQLPIVIAMCGGFISNVDFIFQDFRQALRTFLFFCCYEVCHISVRGPLFEIFVGVSQNICRRVNSFPSGKNDSIGFDGSMAGFKPAEFDLYRIVTDRCNIRGSIRRRGAVMPVRQVFWVGAAILEPLQDKAVMLMLYEVEKFKYVTSVLYSEPFSEEQLSRYVMFLQPPLLTSSMKPVLVPKGQGHLRTKVGSLGTTSQWKEATGAGSVQNDCRSGASDSVPSPTCEKISTMYEEPGINSVTVALVMPVPVTICVVLLAFPSCSIRRR